MGKLSIAMASVYGNKYLPMIKQNLDIIECCYGLGFPRNYVYTDEPLKKMILTKIPSRISGFVIKPFCRFWGLPNYYPYFYNLKLFDEMFCKKVARDNSNVVFLNPLLCKTAEECKKRGKIVICEAGNSEPNREHNRIVEEYKHFDIKHQYIYGNPKYKERVNRSYAVSDYIVTISKLSEKTYLDAGYKPSQLHLIPLTGADYLLHEANDCLGKEQAFISTAFHSFIKGTHRLLLAWKAAGVKNRKLYVVGSLHDDIKEFITRNGPFENVEFVGHKSNLKDWYNQFDAVGILMSLSEGAGRVTPELMSFGFPMITSPDATCDLVVDGFNGKIVEPQNAEKLAETLRYFNDNWDRVHEMRKNVLNSVSKRSVKDYSIDLGEFLREIATSN